MSALAHAIAGEEAAIYAYGLAGARLASTDRDRALGGLAAHRARLLQLRELAGTSALPGAPGGYDVAPPADEPQARALLADVESRLAATYADLAAATSGDERVNAALAACECEVRAIGWGGEPEAFPGR
ncbi:MAG: hypothetical protein B7C55_00395 [Actinomycetales bacterium mxb001]|nr:MAG: hypothetical protein B7C55_00395 [Actinomycetales bacterium mxb001]